MNYLLIISFMRFANMYFKKNNITTKRRCNDTFFIQKKRRLQKQFESTMLRSSQCEQYICEQFNHFQCKQVFPFLFFEKSQLWGRLTLEEKINQKCSEKYWTKINNKKNELGCYFESFDVDNIINFNIQHNLCLCSLDVVVK